MRHEVIKLTDAAIYPELIKLLESKGEPIFAKSRKGGEGAFLFFDGDEWIRGDEDDIEGEYTPLIDLEFLQKYAMNTAPEPDKERELLEKFAEYRRQYNRSTCDGDIIDTFLSYIRKPAFELVTVDNARVTDPEQIVWWISGSVSKGQASDMKNWGYRCWSTEEAALDYRLNNTPAIKLSDMTLEDVADGHYYVIKKEEAHNLVNERINGKQPHLPTST